MPTEKSVCDVLQKFHSFLKDSLDKVEKIIEKCCPPVTKRRGRARKK